MNHLLKKITFAGAKSKPKPAPATLTPPRIGDLTVASSYTYAETLDLISDGPIAGLVNKNGLILDDKNILQGIYLDNTSVAVSNDQVLSNKSTYNRNFKLEIMQRGVYLSNFFKNFINLNITVHPKVVPPKGYKVLSYYQALFDNYGDSYLSDLNTNDNNLINPPTTNFTRQTTVGEENMLTNANNLDSVNTDRLSKNNESILNLLISGSTKVLAGTNYNNKYLDNLQKLLDFYNGVTTNYGACTPFERKYLENIFTKYFGSDWQNNQTTVVNKFINTIKSDLNKVIYILKMNDSYLPDVTKNVLDANGKLLSFEFKLEDINQEDVLADDKNCIVYDFVLPRIDNQGNTTGKFIGIYLIVINGQFNTYTKDYTTYVSFSTSLETSYNLANVKYFNLRNIDSSDTTTVDNQKYNYTNILAEYRQGNEYQLPFKYINNVLIDKNYGGELYGPFKTTGDVQRIVENAYMLGENATATESVDGPIIPRYYNLTTDTNKGLNSTQQKNRAIPTDEGSIDGSTKVKVNNVDTQVGTARAASATINYSDWNNTQVNYDEVAISQKHIIYNPNVTKVFITICIQRLCDTLSKTSSVFLAGETAKTTLDAGTKFPTIVNVRIEVGSINSYGVETASSTRDFSIVALVESPTYIDIGNPDGRAYISNDYKFISEYGAGNNLTVFDSFVLPSLTDANRNSALDSNEKRYIKITKLSTETNSTLIAKSISLSKVTEIIPLNFSYPNSAIVGTKIDSRTFSAMPARTFDCKLKKVKVPSNYYPSLDNGKDKRYYLSTSEYSSTNKLDKLVYDGDWDGTFKKDPITGEDLLEWTDNPAWVLYDLLTNNRYGLGQYIDENQIDIFDLYKIARFCDAVDDFGYFVGVSDGAGGLEPRFSCNIYFQEGIKLFDAINMVSTLFRGMIYYTNSEINFLDDRPKDPIALFTNLNVKDGFFNYTNYRRDEQFNSIEIIYLDRFENFQTKIEYIEDEEDIRKRGIFKKSIRAEGVTSKAMARRIGQHAIYQTIKENQSVSFIAGLESLLCKPGDLIIIEDELKSLQSNFGKVLDIDLIKNSIRISDRFSQDSFNNKITIYTPTGYQTREDVLNIADNKRSRLDGFYLNQGGWIGHEYLTGDYSFSRYSDGFSPQKTNNNGILQEQYAFYTGSNARFCYFSTGFTGWVLGTGLPFKDNMAYDKFIMGQNDFTFDSVNRGSGYFYNTSISNRRYDPFNVALNGQYTGANSKFKNISGELEQYTQGLLDSDIQSNSPSQITTFGVSGIINYDYGSEVFIDQNDMNAALLAFAKVGSVYRFQRKFTDDQVYKILSIAEENPNEYQIVCNKYNAEKYKLIENQKTIEYQSNTYSYTLTQKINNTVYSVLNSPIILSLTTGIDPLKNNSFYISGNWKPVVNAKGYNIKFYRPNNTTAEVSVNSSVTNYVFYNEDSVGHYSFRVNASGNNGNAKEMNQQTYFDSDYNSSGIFIVYEGGTSLISDRPYISSLTIL